MSCRNGSEKLSSKIIYLLPAWSYKKHVSTGEKLYCLKAHTILLVLERLLV